MKKILNRSGIVFLLVFLLFPPDYLRQNTFVDNMLFVPRIISWVIIILIYVRNIQYHIQKKFNVFLIVMWISLLLSTLRSKDGATLYDYSYTAAMIIVPIFLVEELALSAPHNGLRGMYYYFSLCVLVNTATVFIFPGAMYADQGGWRCWILGDDNTAYAYYIMASTIAMLYCNYIAQRTTFISVCVWGSAFIYVFQRGIGTGILCQVMWGALFIGFHFKWIKKFLNPRYVLYITVGAFLLLVVYRQFILEPIVTAVGKDITLTGRTVLWDIILKDVCMKPFLGYGVISNDTFESLFSVRVGSPHNYALRLLIYGGVIAFVLFGLMIFFGCKADKTIRKTEYYRCIAVGLIVFAFRFLVETGRVELLYMLLAMTAYSNEFIENMQRRTAPGHIRIKRLFYYRLTFRKGKRKYEIGRIV